MLYVFLSDFFIICGVTVLEDLYKLQPACSLHKVKNRYAAANPLNKIGKLKQPTLAIPVILPISRFFS